MIRLLTMTLGGESYLNFMVGTTGREASPAGEGAEGRCGWPAEPIMMLAHTHTHTHTHTQGNEFGHPEWIDFPRDDSYDPSTGAFVPGACALVRMVVVWCVVAGVAPISLAAGPLIDISSPSTPPPAPGAAQRADPHTLTHNTHTLTHQTHTHTQATAAPLRSAGAGGT